MARLRYIPRPASDVPGVPFDTTEDAWFWYVHCQVMRQEGGVFQDGVDQIVRPCDPDDIHRAAMALKAAGRIGGHHLTTLARFGLLGRPPDPRCREEEWAARMWDEALDRLTTVLRAKGIVEIPPARQGDAA